MAKNVLNPHQIIRIPELAEALELESLEFCVEEVMMGGMGVCARIRNLRSGSTYALKAINIALIPDENAWRRWQLEMRVWLQLSAHAGVVTAHCVCRVNDIPCVAARWMDGGNLRPRLLGRNPALFYQTALRVARTLEWAYSEHGVIHRDLKPENLLLDGEGVVFVSDWGIARRRGALENLTGERGSQTTPREESLTQTGQFLGTVIYASPEQICGQGDIDHRSDIYSLGCILFEWESGRPPFLGRSVQEIAERHLHARPPRLSRFLRMTAFGAESVILRCLEKAPTDRFKDYSEFVAALQAAAVERGVPIDDGISGQRYRLPMIGKGSVRQAFTSGAGAIDRAVSRDGQFAVVDFSNLEPFIREVEILLGLKEWNKAEEILAHLCVPDMPLDNDYTASVAVNYSLCLVNLHRATEAVAILDRFADVRKKPCAYYVNFSLALLHCGDPRRAEGIAQAGLNDYCDDPDLLSNLVIARRHQGKLPEALETARRRLAKGRNVHTLEEAALVLWDIALKMEDRDLPAAAGYYSEAANLLLEVKALNPRFLTARANLAGILVDMGFLSEALQEVSEVWEYGPNPDVGHSLAATAARAMDRSAAHRECLDLCDRWLKKFPGDMKLQRIRAETIVDGFCIGREQDGVRVVEPTSLAFFETAIADPATRLTSDLLYLARLREWMGDITAAKKLAARARAERLDWWEPPFVLAGFEWHGGNLDACKELLRVAATLAPWRPQPWRLLEHVLHSNDLTADAARAGARAEDIERQRRALLRKPAAVQ
jgi:tetratricopeptide (TPR) repeat protein